MKINSLSLTNFRNYKKTTINLSPSINIFIGDKTLTITNIPSSPLTKKADELLKPFVRDDESRNITKGTGLGLAIAQRDLSLLGMDLSLKCDNDLFTVTIRY